MGNCAGGTRTKENEPLDQPNDQTPADAGAPDNGTTSPAASPAAEQPTSTANAPIKKKKKKKPTGLGVDPDFKFVPGDHNVKDLWKDSNIGIKKVKLLGKGASCEVWHCTRENDEQKTEDLAVKCMERDDKWNPILFPQEYELLSQLDHENILKYRDCYMDAKYFYVCTEMGKGGELFDHIKKKKRFSEKDAAKIVKVIISAIGYCHSKNIVHRDLKPENIIYKNSGGENDYDAEDLVIIDYGDAKVVKDKEEFEDFVGTAFYLAPECVRKRFGWELKKSDMWTIGVITYVLLTGRPPFYGKGNREILKKIIRGKVTFPASIKLSREAIDFVLKLLNTNTQKRFTAAQALQHAWLRGNAKDDDLGAGMLSQLANYSRSSKLKKVLIRMIANEMTEQDHSALRKEFDALDTDNSGTIDLKELTQFIANGGVDPNVALRRASLLMQELDTKGKGEITFAQFSEARLAKELHNENLIKQEFHRIDKDGNGYIDYEELATLFNWTLSNDLVNSMISEIDKNGDGQISYEEFKTAMMKGAIANDSAMSPRVPMGKEIRDIRKEFATAGSEEVKEN